MKEKLDIKDIMVLGLYNDGKKIFPVSAILLGKDETLVFTPIEVASFCMTVFNTFINNVEKDKKEEFANLYKEGFEIMFENRDKYSFMMAGDL